MKLRAEFLDSMSMDTPPCHSHSHSHHLRRIYNTVDENGDGLLSVGEIHVFMEKLGIDISKEEVESVVGPLCGNGEGGLSFEEFGSLCHSIEAAESEDLMEAFRIFDKNEDGYISPTDLQHVLSALGFPQGRDLAHCQRMICTFDQDSNGVLDFSEFRNMMTSNLVAPEVEAEGEGIH